MTLVRLLAVSLLCFAAACSRRSPGTVRQDEARLRASIEKRYASYKAAIESETPLAADTLAWLDGSAVTASRAQAVAEAKRLMDRWAALHFAPRVLHEEIRSDRYSSPEAREAHRRILEALRARYIEWHDFQRYAKYASESEMHHTPPGSLSPQLQEFRSRLQTRRPAVDEIRPLLDTLAKTAS